MNTLDAFDLDPEIEQYLASLKPIEKEALQVARKCLPNIFRIRETAGFKTWTTTQKS